MDFLTLFPSLLFVAGGADFVPLIVTFIFLCFGVFSSTTFDFFSIVVGFIFLIFDKGLSSSDDSGWGTTLNSSTTFFFLIIVFDFGPGLFFVNSESSSELSSSLSILFFTLNWGSSFLNSCRFLNSFFSFLYGGSSDSSFITDFGISFLSVDFLLSLISLSSFLNIALYFSESNPASISTCSGTRPRSVKT